MADPVNPDTAALAAQLGIDPSGMPAPGGAAASGPKVFWGQKLTSVDQGHTFTPAQQINPLTGEPLGSLQSFGATETLQGPYPNYTDETLSVEEAKLKFNTMSPEEVRSLAAQLQKVGILDEHYSYGDVESAWDDLVEKASRNYAAGLKLSPFDMISRYYGDADAKGPGSLTTRKVVEKSLQLTDNDQARSMLTRIMQADLGRKPNEKEVDDFQAALNAAQKASPQMRTTTTGYNPKGERVSEESVSSGGVDTSTDDGSYTDTYAQKNYDSEYGRYQAATTYANAMFAALKSPV